MIVAMSGYAGAGKDSVADVLVEDYGFKRYAFADILRLAAAALNPIVSVDPYGSEITYNTAIEMVGYNEAKFKYPEVRALLQRLGTEVGRELLGDNVWVDATFRRIENETLVSDDVVITDCRFPNEAHAVKNRGGIVVRVERPGVEAANSHPSETSLDMWPFDFTISNDGGLIDLVGPVESLYKFVESRRSGLTLT